MLNSEPSALNTQCKEMRNEPRASWRSWGPHGDDGHAPGGGCCWPCHGIISCLLWFAWRSRGGSAVARYWRSGDWRTTDGSRDRREATVQPAHAHGNRLSVDGEMSSLIYNFLHSQTNVSLLCMSFVICWLQTPIVGRKYNYVLHKWSKRRGHLGLCFAPSRWRVTARSAV